MVENLKTVAEEGRIDGLHRLIKQEPGILDQSDAISFVDTPLHDAASFNRTHFALEIIKLKPSFGRKLNPDGLSPLHLALEKGNFETVRQLIKFDRELIRTLNRQALNRKDEEGNTVLHAAVSASKPEMVKLLVKENLLNKNENNLKGDTALDVAEEGLQTGDAKTTIKNILVSAGALQRLSLAGDCSPAGLLKSPEQPWEILFQSRILSRQRTSPKLFNIVLVVAVLIATTTFQAVLSPPGGGGSGGNNLLTNGSNINATVSSTNNNLPDSNVSLKSYIATIFTPPDNSIERVPMKDPHGRGLKYVTVFFIFYLLNTVSFVASIATIIAIIPFRDFLPLHCSLLCLMMSYGLSFSIISPSYAYALGFLLSSWACAVLLRGYGLRQSCATGLYGIK
ncbi:ankyrin repeat-containing protein BDA1-like [Actinidia eriantha]|uniref:ankyrin repeat-containing protein BDA1-like n=1 Tax=Actinidia eriantha TaxID=165200 RepID=UPI002588F988|nr:ankyrin repeat-containing protein BDA1-like [Actinidia eriantha]